MFTGFALCIGYIALGCGWLIIKTEGILQDRAKRYFKRSFVILLLCISFVSIYLPVVDTETAERWFSFPASLVYWVIPFALSGLTWFIFSAIKHQCKYEYVPYIGTISVFILSFMGFCIHIFPYIVPKQISLWDAASPDESLSFLLYGVVIFLPVILSYTAFTYFVFRGKTRLDDVGH